MAAPVRAQVEPLGAFAVSVLLDVVVWTLVVAVVVFVALRAGSIGEVALLLVVVTVDLEGRDQKLNDEEVKETYHVREAIYGVTLSTVTDGVLADVARVVGIEPLLDIPCAQADSF